MIALLLSLATFAPSPIVVEVCEINTTPNDPEVKDRELVAEEDRMSYGLQ
jgi:hypothetical protein